MIKYLFILLNSLILFLFSLVNRQGEPSISSNFPSGMVVNHEVVVEIRVKRSDISGFASLQLDLPPGFSAREMENSGATCVISSGQILWTWQSIESEEEEFGISIGITADTSSIGKRSIGASFYYLENNEKKSKDMQTVELNVLNEGESERAMNTGQSADTSLTSKKSAAENDEHLKGAPNAEPSGVIEVQRTFTAGSSEKEMLVEVSIKKGITKGFARYSDNIEPGFSARALKTDGSSFSMADGKVKFVWVNVPDKEELKVTYVLICLADARELTLRGEYSYLEHNQSKKSKPGDQTVRFNIQGTVTETKKTEPPQQPSAQSESADKSPVEPKNKGVQNKLETQLKKQNGAPEFEVQIGAFSNSKVKHQTLVKKFGIREPVRSEFADNFSKFMVGKHGDYRSARTHRDELIRSNGIKSSFVVAYNNGKRITVQEALMISNQKWFK